jgi:hypothetical protein
MSNELGYVRGALRGLLEYLDEAEAHRSNSKTSEAPPQPPGNRWRHREPYSSGRAIVAGMTVDQVAVQEAARAPFYTSVTNDDWVEGDPPGVKTAEADVELTANDTDLRAAAPDDVVTVRRHIWRRDGDEYRDTVTMTRAEWDRTAEAVADREESEAEPV